MSNEKYTPGPWKPGMSSVLVKSKNGGWARFAGFHGRAVIPPGEARANLRLAAAAPELIKALELALPILWSNQEDEYGCIRYQMAINAISKAIGYD